jgi:hypothetical protein
MNEPTHGRSLMLVTALSPMIGYDKASAIAHKANDEGLTLKEAALRSGYIDERRFDEIVDPKKMVGQVSAEAEGPTARGPPPSVDNSRAAQALLIVLSVTAGCTDIIGFLVLNGLFTAHITGNLVILAAHIVLCR